MIKRTTDPDQSISATPTVSVVTGQCNHRPRHGRLGLSRLDKANAAAFIDGDARELIALVREAAEALSDPNYDDATAARQRILARETAAAKATFDLLISALGEHVRNGVNDDRELYKAWLLDKLANSACRRFIALIAASERRQAAVSIENAVVRIEAGS